MLLVRRFRGDASGWRRGDLVVQLDGVPALHARFTPGTGVADRDRLGASRPAGGRWPMSASTTACETLRINSCNSPGLKATPPQPAPARSSPNAIRTCSPAPGQPQRRAYRCGVPIGQRESSPARAPARPLGPPDRTRPRTVSASVVTGATVAAAASARIVLDRDRSWCSAGASLDPELADSRKRE